METYNELVVKEMELNKQLKNSTDNELSKELEEIMKDIKEKIMCNIKQTQYYKKIDRDKKNKCEVCISCNK